MLSRLARWGPLLAVLTVAGCVVNEPTTYQDGDAALFAADVQPIIARECAYEGCHGREGMPLTLYAVDFLRLRDPEGDVDTAGTALDERALSESELEHNRRAFAGRVSVDDPLGEDLIGRLIPREEGGVPHGGVVVYRDSGHPDIEVLRSFLRTVDAD